MRRPTVIAASIGLRLVCSWGLVLAVMTLSGCATTLTPGQKVLFGDEPSAVRASRRDVHKATRLTAAIPFAKIIRSSRQPSSVAPLILGQSPLGLSGDGPDLGGGLTTDPGGSGVDRWIRSRPAVGSQTATSADPAPDGRFEPSHVFGTHTSAISGDVVPPAAPGESLSEPVPEMVWEDSIWDRHVDFGQRLWKDQQNLYDLDTIAPFAIAVGGAAIIANSGIDREFAEDYQEHIFNDGTDKASSWVKWMGDGRYTLPILGVATALSIYVPEDDVWGPVGSWGQRSLRATATGALPLWVMQRVIGSGRPGLDDNNYSWAFWDHHNGVSGHTFISAVPFITAARMVENPWAKAGLYLGSTLTGWSRINDHDHYLSQVLLGWFLAYLSVDAIFDTDAQAVGWHLVSIPAHHGQGVGLEYRF